MRIQAITYNSAVLLSIAPLGINFSDSLVKNWFFFQSRKFVIPAIFSKG